ncbi:MAG: hypothetical protein M3092_09115 [Actinomycetia bacterium]|nr:hypothetical protein [Actinomycetes bacterium]
MTDGDRQDRVRPIDYTPDDSFSPQPGNDHPSELRKPRPWVALALSAVAVLTAVGAVAAFGSLEFNDPEPPEPQEFASGAQNDEDTDAPPDTLPPRLEDSLPNLTDRLTLVAIVDDTLQTLLWDPSFRVPKAYDLPIEGVDEDTDIEATFDSGGRTLAVTVTTPQSKRVYLGDPTNVGRSPDIVGLESLIWHASQVGAIAWVLPSSDRQWDLYTGKVNPLTGTITNVAVITHFTTAVGLVRWDSSGFVLNRGSDVVAIGPAGEPEWIHAGVAVSGSASILAVIAPDDSASNTRWVIMDRYSGEATPQQVTGTPGEIWVTTSRDTDLIAEISASIDKTRILVDGPALAAKRIVQVDLHVAPIGFTSSGEYFQFNMFDSNDLVFVNWRTGATHTVPIPDNTTVIGSDLG